MALQCSRPLRPSSWPGKGASGPSCQSPKQQPRTQNSGISMESECIGKADQQSRDRPGNHRRDRQVEVRRKHADGESARKGLQKQSGVEVGMLSQKGHQHVRQPEDHPPNYSQTNPVHGSHVVQESTGVGKLIREPQELLRAGNRGHRRKNKQSSRVP